MSNEKKSLKIQSADNFVKTGISFASGHNANQIKPKQTNLFKLLTNQFHPIESNQESFKNYILQSVYTLVDNRLSTLMSHSGSKRAHQHVI